MPSQVDIANLALGWLGANLITSINDDSTEANLIRANWDMLRDAVLEDGAWTFAVKRYSLPPEAAQPEYGYAYQFVLPGEVIRVLECRNDNRNIRNENALQWEKEGNRILTDSETLQVRAVTRITDPNLFTSGFAQAFAARLASDLCVPITENYELHQQMWNRYNEKLAQAAMTDGSQGRNVRYRSNWLNNVRGYAARGITPWAGPTV